MSVLVLAAGLAACTSTESPSSGRQQLVQAIELKYTTTQPDAWRVIDAFLADRGLQIQGVHAPPPDGGHYFWHYATPEPEFLKVRIEGDSPKHCFAVQIYVPEESQDYRGARELRTAFAELAQRESWKLECNGVCMA